MLILHEQAESAATSSVKSARRVRRAQNVYVSVFGPSKTRKRAWFTGRCRRCQAHVFGAMRAVDLVDGPRRLSCGHVGYLIPARTYLSPSGQAGDA